ncbi:carboxypeptidase-like regulatory domain-containing protein [Hymenobacter qilianensis]|uniref:carboxypeptidase-like regulatory domain-containing protein n=1 Tax=Hymenobacter qilianensis TaxID=1385715 RepID=UPI001CB9BC18|nr:carboxypeptidase-like regulatory domain-containing protein [Hymenobacter qilianensis]
MKHNYLASLLRLCAVFALLLWHSAALAQGQPVTGTVTDDKGEGLPGATVVVKGTTTGTSTDVGANLLLRWPQMLRYKLLTSAFWPRKCAWMASRNSTCVWPPTAGS